MMKKAKNDINGWLVLDKPYGMGSTQAVSRIKRLLSPAKIGHAGTLDPLATGVLPIALGKATRLIPFVMDGRKTYRFAVRWGTQTDSDDLAGQIIATSPLRPTRAAIEEILPRFVGDVLQTPPVFSALKIGGQRAYHLARAGKAVVPEPRTVRIESCALISHEPDTTRFQVVCGKGTYIRSIAREMGSLLGCGGVVAELRRTRCGPFDESRTISLDFMEKSGYNPDTLPLIALETALADIWELAVQPAEAERFIKGQRVPASSFGARLPQEARRKRIGKIVCQENLIGLVRYEKGVLHPYRILVGSNTVL